MAGTTSATTRQSHALTAIRSAGLKHVRRAMLFLGKDDFARGTCIAAAGLLSASGVLAPHIDNALLGPLLCISGAALALLAANRSFDSAAVADQSARLTTARRSAHDGQIPVTLAELTHAAPSRRSEDSDAIRWSRLTHRMSHELRTPLNAVIGFSELMNAEVFGPLGAPQYQDYARSIHVSGRILLKNAEDALAITSLLTRETPVCEPVACLRTALDEAIAFHRPELAGRGGPLPQVDIKGPHDVLGEPQTVRQILVNLIAVTLDQSSRNVRIGIDVCALPDEIVIEFSTAREGLQAGGEDCFALLLARTLAHLSQARVVQRTNAGTSLLAVHFPRARQHDFFAG